MFNRNIKPLQNSFKPFNSNRQPKLTWRWYGQRYRQNTQLPYVPPQPQPLVNPAPINLPYNIQQQPYGQDDIPKEPFDIIEAVDEMAQFNDDSSREKKGNLLDTIADAPKKACIEEAEAEFKQVLEDFYKDTPRGAYGHLSPSGNRYNTIRAKLVDAIRRYCSLHEIFIHSILNRLEAVYKNKYEKASLAQNVWDVRWDTTTTWDPNTWGNPSTWQTPDTWNQQQVTNTPIATPYSSNRAYTLQLAA